MDSMVGTAMTIEREMGDAQSTRDAGVSFKRKESQSSSSSGKRRKAFASQGFQEQGRGYQGQGQDRVFGQVWGPCGHVASPNWRKIQSWWIKWIRNPINQ